MNERDTQSIRRHRSLSDVRRDDVVDSVQGLAVQDSEAVEVDIAHAGREAACPGRREAQPRGGAARREVPPPAVLILDQERVAARRPVERSHVAQVEHLARKPLLIHDPQAAGRAVDAVGGECDPVMQRLQRAGGERESRVVAQLVAVHVDGGGVDEDLVVGVRRKELRRGDDCALCIGRIETYIEWDGGTDRERALQRGGIHRAREVDLQISRRIDAAVAAGRRRAGEVGRSFSGEAPVVTERVGIAGEVAIARLENDLVCRQGVQRRMVVDELVSVDPLDGPAVGR